MVPGEWEHSGNLDSGCSLVNSIEEVDSLELNVY